MRLGFATCAATVLLAACGRLGFDPAASPNADANAISDTSLDTSAPCGASGPFPSGDGSRDAPFTVLTTAHLAAIGADPALWVCSFRLETTLDLTGVSLTPIGTDAIPFAGVFDGNGHTLSHLRMTVSGPGGFFGVTRGAELHSLVLDDAVITGVGAARDIGLLAGKFVNSSAHDITANGVVRGANAADPIDGGAGLIGTAFGENQGRITLERITVSLRSEDVLDGVSPLAGFFLLSGQSVAEIRTITAVADLGHTAQTENTFGGLLSYIVADEASEFTLEDAVASGTIELSANGSFSGSLLGTVGAGGNSTITIRRVGSTVSITTPASFPAGGNVGGLAGVLGSSNGSTVLIEQAYSRGAMVISNTTNPVASQGTLLGRAGADGNGALTLRDVYSHSSIHCVGPQFAVSPGIGSFALASGGTFTIERVYTAGALTSEPAATLTNAGGVIGELIGPATITGDQVFWDSDANPLPAAGNAGASIVGATGLSAATLRAASTYATWDPAVWQIVDGQLPVLRTVP